MFRDWLSTEAVDMHSKGYLVKLFVLQAEDTIRGQILTSRNETWNSKPGDKNTE